MLDIPYHPKRDEYQDSQPCGDGEYPCVVCGKPIGMANAGLQVRLWYGACLVAESEVAGLLANEDTASGDTGYYPIGRNCARKYLTPKDRAKYVTKVAENEHA